MADGSHRWPRLSYVDWSDAALTLHLWTQIVGKIRLTLTPWLNHSWHVPYYVTARGLSTTPIPAGDEVLEFEFDFLRHRLVARSSSGEDRALPLEPRPVADFYAEVLDLLSAFGIDVALTNRPCELPEAIPFSSDRVHSAYDPQAAHAFWRTLVSADRVFKLFRTGFVGKASQCISSGAASISRLRAFPGEGRRCTQAACPASRTWSSAKPIRTK